MMRYLLRPLGVLAVLAGGLISLYVRFTNVDQTETALLVHHFGPFALATVLILGGVVAFTYGEE